MKVERIKFLTFRTVGWNGQSKKNTLQKEWLGLGKEDGPIKT